MVSFLQNSISLIEVLHHHSRHSRHLRHSNHTGSKLNVLFLSKGVFPNYRNYFVGFLLNVGIDILFLEDFRQDIFTRHFFFAVFLSQNKNPLLPQKTVPQ